jgi:hypothetical protein
MNGSIRILNPILFVQYICTLTAAAYARVYGASEKLQLGFIGSGGRTGRKIVWDAEKEEVKS